MKKILIVEDEKSISDYIRESCKSCLEGRIQSIKQVYNIDDAFAYIASHQLDILLLDLNLNEEDGFKILNQLNSDSFLTIIISAYKEKAVEAFEYGVVDFVPKPFTEQRLKKAFERCETKKQNNKTKYLPVKNASQYYLLDLEKVKYFEAADIYVEAVCYDGKRELLNQNMKKLELILPERFLRIHRSFIVDLASIRSFSYVDGGRYEVVLKDDTRLPLNRNSYKRLKSDFS